MQEFLDSVQRKYNYDGQIMAALAKIVPAMVQHYGAEYKQIILEAIEHCPIHVKQKGEDATKYLTEYLPTKEPEWVPTVAVGFYNSAPVINKDKVETRRLIYMNKDDCDFENQSTLSTLVHELGHAVKSYKNEFHLANGAMYQRSGLSYTKFKEHKDDDQKLSEESSKGTGLHEIINCYDEAKVMSIVCGKEVLQDSYSFLTGVSNCFGENEGLNKLIRSDEFNGTQNFRNELGKERYDKLIEQTDSVYNSTFCIPKDMMKFKDKEERKQFLRSAIVERDNLIDEIIKQYGSYSVKSAGTCLG